MPSKNISPYASQFKSGIKGGAPCSVVVAQIARRTGKPVTAIYNSLFKAGLCFRQKFNGTWLYWPTFVAAGSATTINKCQTNLWQCLIDWCVLSRNTTPGKLRNKIASQTEFMTFGRSLFGKQFAGVGVSKPKSRKSKSKSKSRRSPWSKSRKGRAVSRTHRARHSRRARRSSRRYARLYR
jgi:hypothetical protein